ncbi:MAG: glutathione S-transferase N-terminal domain-containing protein, partial [Oceanospirillaceae bacterium]|nr:glutathione S-transferase N-terminal domain-containing protein [Oceanospirillaceae bacterium]
KPGDPFEVSDADTMLNYINANAEMPKRVSMITKPGCPHCSRAKAALSAAGMRFEVIELGQQGISYSTLQAISGRGTVPQIFIDGEHIGGADDLEAWMSQPKGTAAA